MIQNNGGQFYVGVVEDRNDPLQIGRVRVRVVGLHIHDKTQLPTEDLPWAMLMQPASGGTGMDAIAPAEGSTCIVIFNDFPENQQPIVIGVLGGIPQGNPVNVDKFEEVPLFKDDITPQGRKIPTTATEVNANQAGPVTVPNPALSSIVQQSQTQTSSTPFGAVQNILQGTSTTFGAVGGLLGAVGGVGSTYGTAKNAFENLLLGSGNVNSALGRFKIMATQSGPLGSAIGAIFNGNASLKDLGRSLGFSVDSITGAFNSIKNTKIKNPRDLMGVIANAEQIAGQISSASSGAGGVLGAITGELGQVSVGGTLGGISRDATGMVGAIGQEIGGVVSAGVGQAQRVADILGLGDVTSGIQGAIGSTVSGVTGGVGSVLGSISSGVASSIGGLLGSVGSSDIVSSIKGVFQNPTNVAGLLNGEYSTKAPIAVNAGNIIVTQQKDINQITQKDFSKVPEGSTPPINGAYGGPNYGGASPVLVKPEVDMSRYEGGSKADLATSPPPSWKGNRAKAEQGIKALLKACDKYGFKTNEQKASLLGIVGGECGWIPQRESAQYSRPDRLCELFPSTFKGDLSMAENYCNWEKGNKGEFSDFFNFVYDPSNNGRQLGNSQPGDGGKFFGRGFIQLTGRANYERYAKLSGHDILKNPDLLITDMDVSAEVAVLYLMDRVKNVVPTAHPGFFYAAKKAVGNNSADIAARKLSYYEHFYGCGAPESYGYDNKQAGNAENPYSYNGALAGNEAGKPNNEGFCDPHRKYPLKRSLNEPETSRLARGVIRETIVPVKQSKRSINIPIAMGAGQFSQPNIPYGTKYPYNRVIETESGHIQEWDDTPGYERVHFYHRTGTFTEIDANGTQVNKIVGDGYTIYDRNGYIHIAGEANVTVNGNVNIYCRSDANIEVEGSAEMKIGGSFDIGVARDMNIAVEGNFSLWANGMMNLQTASKGHILSKEDMFVSSNEQLHLLAENSVFVESKTADFHLLSAKSNYIASGEETNVVTGTDAKITSVGSTHIKATGNVEVDGAITNINSGTAASGTTADPATKALVHGMVPPPLGVPIRPVIETLSNPPTLGEEKFMYELPEEGQVGVSPAYNEERTAQEGKTNTYESEKATGTGGGGSIVPSSRQKEILGTEIFTADFRLSTHFTLGMMFDGGFNARHKLVDQNGLTKQQIVANLAALCENILEKYLEVLPDGIQGYGRKWKISSGYRMGTNTSDHSRGRACDIALIGGKERKELHFQLIKQLDKLVPYDQIILEYEGEHSTWIHTSFRGDGSVTYGGGTNRKMAFTMNNHKTVGQGFILLG